MFREKTTFVIGAGASAEFGLPVGTGLAANIKIAARLPKPGEDPTQHHLLRWIDSKFLWAGQRGEAHAALVDIHEAVQSAVSIDAFLHRRRAEPIVTQVGKALIALEILKAEGSSTLSHHNWRIFHEDPNLALEMDDYTFIDPDRTWIGHFFRTLTDGIENADDVGKNVTIICFNYDRCIEHYLAETLAFAYKIGPERAMQIVERNFSIIHPYGYLGKLTTNPMEKGGDRIAFGYPIEYGVDLDEFAAGIQTYTEQAHDAGKLWRMQEALVESKNLIFLGFGFNNQNLDLLRIKHRRDFSAAPKDIFATGFGLYRQIENTLRRRLLDLYLPRLHHDVGVDRVHLEFGVGCEELFRIHDMNFRSFTENVFTFEELPDGMVAHSSPFTTKA